MHGSGCGERELESVDVRDEECDAWKLRGIENPRLHIAIALFLIALQLADVHGELRQGRHRSVGPEHEFSADGRRCSDGVVRKVKTDQLFPDTKAGRISAVFRHEHERFLWGG